VPVEFAETFRVAAPVVEGVTETDAGKLVVGPEGDTLAVRSTVPLKLFSELTITL
jgi:hypothetical protein